MLAFLKFFLFTSITKSNFDFVWVHVFSWTSCFPLFYQTGWKWCIQSVQMKKANVQVFMWISYCREKCYEHGTVQKFPAIRSHMLSSLFEKHIPERFVGKRKIFCKCTPLLTLKAFSRYFYLSLVDSALLIRGEASQGDKRDTGFCIYLLCQVN